MWAHRSSALGRATSEEPSSLFCGTALPTHGPQVYQAGENRDRGGTLVFISLPQKCHSKHAWLDRVRWPQPNCKGGWGECGDTSGERCPCHAVGLSLSSAPEARKSTGAEQQLISPQRKTMPSDCGEHSPSLPGTTCLQGVHSVLPQGLGASFCAMVQLAAVRKGGSWEGGHPTDL